MRTDRPTITLTPLRARRQGLPTGMRLGLVWTSLVAFFFLLVCAFNLDAFFSVGVMEAIGLFGVAPWLFISLFGWAVRR